MGPGQVEVDLDAHETVWRWAFHEHKAFSWDEAQARMESFHRLFKDSIVRQSEWRNKDDGESVFASPAESYALIGENLFQFGFLETRDAKRPYRFRLMMFQGHLSASGASPVVVTRSGDKAESGGGGEVLSSEGGYPVVHFGARVTPPVHSLAAAQQAMITGDPWRGGYVLWGSIAMVFATTCFLMVRDIKKHRIFCSREDLVN
ncbi:hypothetical protein [Roseibacillus ishigakijimensis]|uniref:Transmembrane protein n=1 Tax=Roseibacillus ishigakijimensis TaxID=454146 RepID=A0A934RJZ6_9BACT|nr:hypothetical protein [Roseibacillus ishigakijimensis]MBK1833092.1 hypothetical protein [Roseibacillus ishigakijimensis]